MATEESHCSFWEKLSPVVQRANECLVIKDTQTNTARWNEKCYCCYPHFTFRKLSPTRDKDTSWSHLCKPCMSWRLSLPGGHVWYLRPTFPSAESSMLNISYFSNFCNILVFPAQQVCTDPSDTPVFCSAWHTIICEHLEGRCIWGFGVPAKNQPEGLGREKTIKEKTQK